MISVKNITRLIIKWQWISRHQTTYRFFRGNVICKTKPDVSNKSTKKFAANHLHITGYK